MAMIVLKIVSLNCLHVVLLLQDDRKTLPVYPYRDELLQAINDHQVCLIDCWHFGCNNLEPIRYGCPYIFTTLIGCKSRFSLLLEKLVLERLLRYLNIFMRQAIPSAERWISSFSFNFIHVNTKWKLQLLLTLD